MGKINETTTVANLANSDYISVVLADGTLCKIKKANLAEAIRSVMSEATSNKNGLLNMSQISDSGSFSTGIISYSDDINNLHTTLGNGLSTIACTVSSINRPYPNDNGGIMINVNRIIGFSIKMIYQIYISSSQANKPKVRYATGNSDGFSFSDWE